MPAVLSTGVPSTVHTVPSSACGRAVTWGRDLGRDLVRAARHQAVRETVLGRTEPGDEAAVDAEVG